MNYRAHRIDESPDVDIRMKNNVSVPSLPSAIPGVARVTRDSAPETALSGQRGASLESQHTTTDNSDHQGGSESQTPITANFAMAPRDDVVQDSASLQESEYTGVSNWNVRDDGLRSIPSFYPLEKSSRYVNESKPSVVSGRISDCCRLMSLQASYDDKAGTASLTTAERVEIHLSLWNGNEQAPDCIIVEAQRRTGCPIIYHKYTRHILDAAQGRFDLTKYRSGSQLSVMDSKEKANPKSDGNDSLLALEIAASLIKKDRMDARRLGLESLCFLTDPSRTGAQTALMASRVVLFGSMQNEDDDDDLEFLNDDLGVREAILSLVQFGELNEQGGVCQEISDSSDDDGNDHTQEKFNALLHNLALAVLANALEVHESYVNESSSDSKSPENTNTFLEESYDISHRELIDSLLKVLGQAESKPHDACLSAQCLRPLLQASKKARRKARDMNAKKIVATALEVGQRTHVKLQTETENVMRQLEKNDDENQDEDDEE